MKTINLILVAVVLTFTSFSQTNLKTAKERIGDMAIVANWKVGEEIEANNVKILRVEGENGIHHRTNVLYIPQSKLLADINQKAATEPIYNRELSELTEYFTGKYPGGQVAIFFDRLSENLANPENFTIILIDPKTNEEIHREKLGYQAPDAYRWGIWYYYTVINIPKKVGEKFTVRVLDEGLQQSNEFQVYDNYPPRQRPASVVSFNK